jgi:hypothetical protein
MIIDDQPFSLTTDLQDFAGIANMIIGDQQSTFPSEELTLLKLLNLKISIDDRRSKIL